SLHSQTFFDGLVGHPECFTYMAMLPFATVNELDDWAEKQIRQDRSRALYAMLDKTRSNRVAGIIGILNTVPENLSTEIGLLFTLPAFQRTHVTRTAVGLLMRFCFDELRLRRVQWRADPANAASIRVAEYMGFQREGIRRWDYVASSGVPGHAARKIDPMPDCNGLHVLYFAICWDDWEGEWGKKVGGMLESSQRG
ncbi:uncharacterized protein PHACADRAFT_103197, partial [Phanerochaete carnosa HHB-10118-sp]